MKTISFLSVLTVVLIYSCNPAEEQKSIETTDTEVSKAIKDSVAKVISTIHDPVPKDSILGDRYDINTTSKVTAELVRNNLINEIFRNDLHLIDSSQRKFMFHEIDLNGDGKKEIFGGFSGSYFCGSGGCMALLLANDGKLINKFSVTEYPIAVSSKLTKGWRDLVFRSKAAKPTLHSVQWNGTKYPNNPSVQPIFKGLPGDDDPSKSF